MATTKKGDSATKAPKPEAEKTKKTAAAEAKPAKAPAKKAAAPKSAKGASKQLELPAVPAPPAAAPASAPAAPAPAATKAPAAAAAPSAAVGGFDAPQLSADWSGAHDAVVRAGDRAPALVEAWIQSKNAAAVASVAEDDAAPAPARKAARRGINVLRSRGVAIPARPPRIVRLAAPEPESFEAWLWAPDVTGTSLVTIAAVTAGGRCRRVDVAMADRGGLLSVRGGESSRGQLRESFDQAESQMGYRPVAVPVEWARARIAEAHEQNAKSGTIVPQGLDRFADLLGPAPTSAPPHPIDAAALPAVDASNAVATSQSLHGEPELRAWIPSTEAIQEMLAKVGESLGSQEAAQDPERVGKALEEEMAAATDRFFTPELRATVAARMKDIALSVLAREGKERAAEVVAVAHAIESAGLITSPPRDVPFLLATFRKALAVLAAQTGQGVPIPFPQRAASPIVDPAEAAAGKAQPGERVSPGGIILP